METIEEMVDIFEGGIDKAPGGEGGPTGGGGGGGGGSDSMEIEPWDIDPNHGMHVGPGYLGDAPHSLRTREVFRYYHPTSDTGVVPPLNTGGDYIPHALSPTLTNSHDPILACLANLVTRTLDAKRCIITLTGTGLSYVIAESTRSLSLHYPHTHSPGDQLFLGAGMATESIGGLCEHTISLLPPVVDEETAMSVAGEEPFLLEIPDLRRHPKYYKAGYVRGWPHGRFYCGAPLRTRSGVSIGTVCVMDDKVRPGGLSPEERVAMTGLAEVVMGYLETKREGEEGRARRAVEIELGRFIAEGFLDEAERAGMGSRMIERRDGRVLSAGVLEERARREAERRKRVEERRTAFQERMFAGMLRREKQRVQREEEQSMRMRKDGNNAPRGPGISKLELSEVTTKAITADGSIVEGPLVKEAQSEPVPVDVDMMEVDEERKQIGPYDDEVPRDPILIAHARTRRKQPGIIELCPEGRPFDSPPPPPPLKDHSGDGIPPDSASLSLIDTIVFPDVPPILEQKPTPPSPFSDPLTRFDTSATNTGTGLTTASTEPDPPASTRSESENTGYRRNRRSNYEESASVEASFRATFSRAASLIHNGIGANVVFLDPDLEGFFTETNPGANHDEEGEDMEKAEQPTYVSSCVDWEVSARASRPKWLRRKTGALAYAVSTNTNPSVSGLGENNLAFDLAALDEVTLAAIVAENRPGGTIIAFGSGAYPGLDDNIAERTKTEEFLPRFLPGVRSAIIVPLVGGENSAGTLSTAPGAVFAVAVVWTCEQTRTFSDEVEGRFVVAVGRGIVAEVGRMNVLNADKAKSEFISSISHELRTPLHGILASADFLAESPRLDSTQRSFVDTIISCASTLLETVNHVLEFQKLNNTTPEVWERVKIPSSASSETGASVTVPAISTPESNAPPLIRRNSIFGGPAPLPPPPVDPNTSINILPVDPTLGTTTATTPMTAQMLAVSTRMTTDLAVVVQDVTEGVCLGYSLKGGTQITSPLGSDNTSPFHYFTPPYSDVSVIINIPPGDWKFDINRASLRRIINNLVGNSLKYNRSGGWVQVSLAVEDTPDGKSRAVFTVSDSGKGISREFLKTKLFTPFSQENPLSAGAGLGLSLVRQLVGIMGGRIDIKSQLGVGTTVVVEMAVAASDSSGKQHVTGLDTALKARVQGKKIRFSGFDDDDSSKSTTIQRHGLRLSKESLIGYAVGYYSMKVVETPGTEDVLIVADPNSPGMHDALSGRRVSVVALCTRPPIPGSTEEDELTRKGMLTFLRKPFGPKRFTQALREMMDLLDQARMAPPPAPVPAPISPTRKSPPSISPQTSSTPGTSALSPPPSLTKQASPPPPTHLSPLCKNPDHSKPTILAVEDNLINMRLLTAFLTKTRYPFGTAADGLEALNLVKAQRDSGGRGFDVILMDLQMPVLSGTESTREIRALEAQDANLDDDDPCKLKRAYIVALTGLAAAKDRQEAFIAGVDAYVVKPAKFFELEKMWLEFLGKDKKG